MKSYRDGGFTLVELLIVLAVVGILIAVAYPSYTQHVARSSRSAAQGELLELANLQEKIYLNSNAYSVSLTTAYTGTAAGGLGKTATTQTADGRYSLTMPVATAQSFEIRATPVAGTPQANDGAFAITSTGARPCIAPVPSWCKNGVW